MDVSDQSTFNQASKCTLIDEAKKANTRPGGSGETQESQQRAGNRHESATPALLGVIPE